MTQTIQEFLEARKISNVTDYADSNPNMHNDGHPMNHWRVVLRNGRKRMTVRFSTGLGIREKPDAADVLDCLASDATTTDLSFNDFCQELGYDTDSRTAERTYRIIQRQSKRLRSFLGEADYDALLYGTERQ